MGIAVYSSSGSWTCPAGVKSVQVECWGRGGNGGTAIYNGSNSYSGGLGGGGGAYAKVNSIGVHQGSNYSFVVGSPTTITIGSTTCTADYGRINKVAGNAANCIGDIVTSGSAGTNGTTGIIVNPGDHVFGGNGGAAANGGSTAAGSVGTGSNGNSPGGGAAGGGAQYPGSLYSGGTGANGQIKFSWTDPVNVVINIVTKKG